jgi:hypothetical protein
MLELMIVANILYHTSNVHRITAAFFRLLRKAKYESREPSQTSILVAGN